jgi:hypothetical protein
LVYFHSWKNVFSLELLSFTFFFFLFLSFSFLPFFSMKQHRKYSLLFYHTQNKKESESTTPTYATFQSVFTATTLFQDIHSSFISKVRCREERIALLKKEKKSVESGG